MYPKGRSAMQNIRSVQITKLANTWEEMEIFVKNWEWSILQSVAIATVKTS